MNLQELMDIKSEQWQRERAETQMTLGKLIERLESMPAETPIDGLAEPHSYRGYYSDIAFERRDDKTTAGELLSLCKGAMGQVFKGYKGGEFVMDAGTPVFVASYGLCGMRLLAIRDDGSIETAPDEV